MGRRAWAVTKAGAIPGVTYGAAVYGLTGQEIRTLNKEVVMAEGCTQSGTNMDKCTALLDDTTFRVAVSRVQCRPRKRQSRCSYDTHASDGFRMGAPL